MSHMLQTSQKILGLNPLEHILLIPSRSNTTMLEITMTNT
jgi:hypothetical protein